LIPFSVQFMDMMNSGMGVLPWLPMCL